MSAHPHFARANALEHLKQLRSEGAASSVLLPALESAAKLCTGGARSALDDALTQVRAEAPTAMQAVDAAISTAIHSAWRTTL